MNQTIIGFLIKEWRQTFRNPVMIGLLFVAPAFQLTFFGIALSTEMRNIRIAFFSKPNDPKIEEIKRRCQASGWFHVLDTEALQQKGETPFSLLQSRQTEAVLISENSKDAKMQLLIDSINMLRARSIENYLENINQDIRNSKNAYLLESTPSRGLPEKPPGLFSFNVRILYNPTLESPVYMVPAVMGMLISIITVLLTSMALSKEKETGTIETLISAPIRKWEILLGKTLPFFFLASLNFPLVLSLAHFGFGVPLRGALWLIILSTLLFIACTVSLGIFISTLAKNQQQSMMGSFLFLFPAILLSGAMFPTENMPIWIKPLVYLNPLTYYVKLLRNLMLKGGGTQVLIESLFMLIVLCLVLMFLSLKRFRNKLN